MNSALKRMLALGMGGILIWLLATWPLALNFTTAIPYADRLPKNQVRLVELVPGDHLQLYYHFWLTRDMLMGKTPLFNNVYEFNMGEDAPSPVFAPSYIPFSLIYAATSPWLGEATGWNLAGLASVLLGLFGVFALTRRYAPTEIAAAAALIATAFPYRWITLLAGSPTGYGIGLVPWLFVGLDRAIRDRRPSGGVIAGLTLLAAYCTDLHTFYFTALATPVWCAAVWLSEPEPWRIDWRRYRATAVALLPVVVLAALAIFLSRVSSQSIDKSVMAGGRTLEEIKLYSPIMSGLYRWRLLGPTNHIFMGASLLALIAVGGGVFTGQLIFSRGQKTPSPPETRLFLLSVIAVTIAGSILISFGTYGPFNALPLRAARKLLPKFAMIRQTAKIFALMPTLLGLLLSLLFAPIRSWFGNKRKVVGWALVLLALAAIMEPLLWLRAGLCDLPATAPAYEAVATHAVGVGNATPRAVAIPLWPGDSHYSSVYEFGIAKSRLRLLNGYAPTVPDDYIAKASDPLFSLNQGVASPEQTKLLKKMGVDYIIFHEQPYPRQVSLFSSGIALRNLFANRLLAPLSDDGDAYSFVILDHPRSNTGSLDLWGEPRYFPSFHWCYREKGNVNSTPGTYNLLVQSKYPVMPHQRYLMRLSGRGKLQSDHGYVLERKEDDVWQTAPMSPPYGDKWKVLEGDIRIEEALIVAGEDIASNPDGYWKWPAADCFHQGVTDTATGYVLIDLKRVPRCCALFAPNLPFPKGKYRASLTSQAAMIIDAGTRDGEFLAAETSCHAPNTILTRADVYAGRQTEIEFDYDGIHPLVLEYHYHRQISLKLMAIELWRLEGGD